MPLQNELPVIDDRTFQEIVDGVRSRIPRYTPEWTDLNESDPGMTMVQLFAWLTEMQIYRMSKVPRLNYIKFLELVGIELEAAKPATASIEFPVLDTFTKTHVIVPARTRVTTEEPDETGPIIFETDRSLIAIKAELDRLQSFDGFAYRDITQENSDVSVDFEPFGHLANDGSAFLMGFDSELPKASISISFSLPIEEKGSPILQCTGEQLQTAVSAELAWEFWNGSEWRKLTLLKDGSQRLTGSGAVEFTGPAPGEMISAAIGKVTDKRYWIRARVSKSGYQTTPRLLAVRTNTVAATQADTIEFETVGGSDGQIDQVVTLSDKPVIDGSLELQVDEGSGFESWTEKPDFFASGPDDTHYVLNRSTGQIRFGDGVNGRVPVANPRRPANFRALQYRVGGGVRGNVKAGSLIVLQSTIEGIDSAAVNNLFAGAGGRDEETFEEARRRAPQVLKSRERAVTAEDFELLAIRSANIARAKALPLFHPSFPGVEVPGVVTVVVVPDVDTEENPAPLPSEGTLQTVCAFLNDRRLLTTELFVIGPRYQEVKVAAELIAEDNADLATVTSNALQNVKRYFDPIVGGEDSSLEEDGSGWPFGGDIFYSLLYRRLLIDGVKRVVSLTVTLDGEECEPCTDVPIEDGILLKNGSHEIEVRYD